MKLLRRFILYPILSILAVLLLAGIAMTYVMSPERLAPLASNALGQQVEIEDSSINFFRNFPGVSIRLDGVRVNVATEDAASIEVAQFDRFWVSVPLLPLLRKEVRVEAIELDRPVLLLSDELLSQLAPAGPAEVDTPSASGDGYVQEIAIERLVIEAGEMAYTTAEEDLYTLEGLDVDISATLADWWQITGEIAVAALYAEQAGFTIADGWAAALQLDAEADLEGEVLRLQETTLNLESLLLTLSGEARQWSSERPLLDLDVQAPGSQVAGLLSILPASFKTDLEGLEASGEMALQAKIQGTYSAESLPTYSGSLTLVDGRLKYPGVADPIENIQLATAFSNEQINITQFSAEAAGNTLRTKATISQFFSQEPSVNGNLEAVLDLSSIQRFYPLEEGTELGGNALAAIDFDGPVKTLRSTGEIELNSVRFAAEYLEVPVEQLSAHGTLDNEDIIIHDLVLQSGNTDAQFEGRLENFMAMALDSVAAGEETYLAGTVSSNFLDVTEQLGEETADTLAVEPLILPPFRMALDAKIDTVRYGGLTLRNTEGLVTLTDNVFGFTETTGTFLGGTLRGNGSFSLADPYHPLFEGTLGLQRVQAAPLFSSLPSTEQIAGLAGFVEGVMNSEVEMSLMMDEAFSPDLGSMLADGVFASQSARLNNLPLQEQLASFIGLDALSNLNLSDWTHQFHISGEQMQIANLSMNAGEYTFQLNGTQAFDGGIDYRISAMLPASAQEAIQEAPVGGALSTLVSVAEFALVDPASGRITLDLLATGTVTSPKIGLDDAMMRNRMQAQAGALADAARQEAEGRIDSLKQAAEAELEAQRNRLADEARNRAANLLGLGADSTATPDTTQNAQSGSLKDQVRGLLGRRKKRNNNQ